MRKTWAVNEDVLSILVGLAAALWFAGWFAVVMITRTGVHGHRHFLWDGWVFVVWGGPFALGALTWILVSFVSWCREEDTWLIRRVVEPVVEDLRTKAPPTDE